ncbi:hypothetical protein QM480_24765 [Flectobacillus sp. DC10W]|uniref:Lipoprotein n=1 Tax=Flectobacillus longus TaxID=2984207 RepID=A0ABT6YWU1_9BACT|nr:hypothetical protein [Flectobacillus longus]MDI9867581.1 hypothetical protein [Flectobacillus longus]
MRHLFKILLFFSFYISSCKNIDHEYGCENIVLEKVDWTYCEIIEKYGWKKCNDSRDTLTMKFKEQLENIKGVITQEDDSTFCLKPNGLNSLTPINLPKCFKRSNLKVVFSGDIRVAPGLNESNCGDLFELTKIEIAE